MVTSVTMPTLRRVFAPGEAIGLACEVARARKDASPVRVQYTISDALGQTLASGDMPAGRGTDTERTHVAAIRLPQSRGQYVVTIEATDGSHVARRAVPIAVR
jgi:hypothetical protein